MKLAMTAVLGGLLTVAGALPAGDFQPERDAHGGPYDVVKSRPATAPGTGATGIRVAPLTDEDRALGRALLGKRGGGGDVVADSLLLLQTRFLEDTEAPCAFPESCGGPCNVLLILWDENTLNLEGVEVFIDGEFLTNVPGLSEVPGTNGLNLLGVPAGRHEVIVEDPNTGTSSQCSITIVDQKPFSDATNVQVAGGGVDAVGNCNLLVTWEIPQSAPEVYLVLIDGGSIGRFTAGPNLAELIRSEDLPLGFYDEPDAEHIATVIGFVFDSESACAVARGCFVESSTFTLSSLSCEIVDCNPPMALQLSQSGYGSQGEILAQWVNGESPGYAVGVHGYIDDLENAVGTLAGTSQGAVFSGLAPGEHTFGVQGDCGALGPSAILAETFPVVQETPYTDPVPGGVTQVFDEPAGQTTATWDTVEDAFIVDVFVRVPGDPPQDFFVATLHGRASFVVITGTTSPDETILLQFFKYFDGLLYASDRIEAVCEDCRGQFVRGGCGDPTVNDPQLTEAIYILGWLYQGFTRPPCMEACDVDGNDEIELTDAVQLLQYLYVGGPPPLNWVNRLPTCEPILVGMDCEEPVTQCPVEEP